MVGDPPNGFGTILVSTHRRSAQLHRVSVYKIFKVIARQAGLGETLQHPHVLKHTAAMLLVKQGANAYMIRQYLRTRPFESTLLCNPPDREPPPLRPRHSPRSSVSTVFQYCWILPLLSPLTHQTPKLFRCSRLQVLSSTGYGKRESVASDAFLRSGLTVAPCPNSAPRIAHLTATLSDPHRCPTDVLVDWLRRY